MPVNHKFQGGKAFGLLKAQQRERCEEINKAGNLSKAGYMKANLDVRRANQEYMEDQKYQDEEDLLEKLDSFKNKYAEFDLNDQGEIDMMGLKRMMEKLGVPKTHLEMKKMISEVTEGISDSINYRDFVKMMLGKRSAVLKLVMIFEDKANGAICKPDGPPPKRDIASLP
uniref:Allograft inflammatory factor 1-like n=1 Tax=Hucho hucho TaxID=62062 RepID=A0A4W5PZC2_9TELE